MIILLKDDYYVLSIDLPGIGTSVPISKSDKSTLAVAAGAILAMLADTMIPEAFEKGHNLTGFTAVIGFLIAFILSKLSEQAG
mgnify:CR=1 FL=1